MTSIWQICNKHTHKHTPRARAQRKRERKGRKTERKKIIFKRFLKKKRIQINIICVTK